MSVLNLEARSQTTEEDQHASLLLLMTQQSLDNERLQKILLKTERHLCYRILKNVLSFCEILYRIPSWIIFTYKFYWEKKMEKLLCWNKKSFD